MIRSWPFVLSGLVLAAVTAGSLTGLEFFAFGLIATAVEGGESGISVQYGLLVAAVATPVFLIGLIFPGVPVWLWLHDRGWRSYRVAAMAISAGATVTLAILTAPAAGWTSLLAFAWVGIPGAAAGLVLRGVAYRAVRPPRPSPARPS
jgi:hypothetical protein